MNRITNLRPSSEVQLRRFVSGPNKRIRGSSYLSYGVVQRLGRFASAKSKDPKDS